jgi:uncharacterized Zn-binding protein involved in type VI secretion
MSAAARAGDATGHPGIIAGPGVASVLIGGKPAAVVGDKHTCGLPPNAGPHPPSLLVKGSASVLIGGRSAARVGDTAGCGAAIVAGAPDVLIGG